MRKNFTVIDVFIGTMLVIALGLLIVVSINKSKDQEKAEIQAEETVENNIVTDNIYMKSSGDENYNYIINANKLAKHEDIPVSFYQRLSTLANEIYTNKGLKGSEIEILGARKVGLTYDITLKANDITTKVKYSTYEDKLSIIEN